MAVDAGDVGATTRPPRVIGVRFVIAVFGAVVLSFILRLIRRA